MRSMCRSLKSNVLLAFGVVICASLFGCERQMPVTSDSVNAEGQYSAPAEVVAELENLRRLASLPDKGFAEILGEETSDHPPVYVPAGSVDALQAAIAAAGYNGKVVLRSGIHTENSMVTVTQRVTIIGENGAILKSNVATSTSLTTVVDPAIWVYGADKVKIWNIDFRPVGTVAGTAIMLENSPNTTVGCNSIEDFQWGILLHNSHRSTISGNRVAASLEWTTGGLPECDAIMNINGSNVRIADNDVSNGTLNVFCSGSDGYFMHNTVRDGFVGMILCKVPAGSFQLPSGAIIGSDISARNWFIQGNNGTGNLYTAYMVIDGANNNLLVNNAASGNGAYDLELLGETCLFGFLTPTSFNNKVVVGPHRNITINDFGVNNRIIGSNTVTHNVSAPCP